MAHIFEPLVLAALVFASCASTRAAIPSPTVPDALKAPNGEKVVARFKASGAQIYTCAAGPNASDASYAWTLKGPEATLMDDNGATQGTHFAGPTWKANDGSAVVAKVVAKADAPTPSAVPWLLLGAEKHDGTGLFSTVTSVQRVDTTGGVAPATGCDASQAGAESRVDYTATYYFYSK
jgi:hypothetical protein